MNLKCDVSKRRQTYLTFLLCMCEYVYLPFSDSFLISALSQIELRKEMQKRVIYVELFLLMIDIFVTLIFNKHKDNIGNRNNIQII